MNVDKLKECLVFFVMRHNRRIQRTKLVKLVYLSDLKSYQERRRPITGIEYISYDHGPWSPLFYKALEQTPQISEKLGITSFGDIQYTYSGTVDQYRFEHLAAEDLAILEDIDAKWGNRSLKDILREAYSTEPFRACRFGETLDLGQTSSSPQ